ncbi:hypothetical protein [Streptomyces litchfieldiae]|uniref:Uncharacterized protein n=1 Tax=Streptomyces litchfieldiae TaxID=3075543 RepID=A0ABU2MZK3_9ACTN|nr:hypothetical protein [Streptomyces sp. DSM 44938]MDT0347081.1 hypothetical protein [Streptomyces sp. DSM 44938]
MPVFEVKAQVGIGSWGDWLSPRLVKSVLHDFVRHPAQRDVDVHENGRRSAVAAFATAAMPRRPVASVFGLDDDNRQSLLAIGEAKWRETMGIPHLDRLRHICDVLTHQGRHGAEAARLLCFSDTGSAEGLRSEADTSPDMALIFPADLYSPTGT